MNANPIPFANSFIHLGDKFYTRQLPTPVTQPGLIRINAPLAQHLGIDAEALATTAGVEVLAGNRIAPGSEPLASVYAGHQFGGWNPQLGDGRAILLGEVIGKDGIRYDIQLKGAGETPYSRMGDGRSPLGPVLREYIVSEAMAALGVPTSRSLAAVTTGDGVYRDELLPGAILTRVAQSHIRVGTFQFFAGRGDGAAVQKLADHVIQRHYPQVLGTEKPYLELLNAVIARQASLIARWQSLGFIHGVMNTDNMLVCGETIDYGPCAFMDDYQANKVFSSIDRNGRYAYENQPDIGKWNLMWLAHALLDLFGEEEKAAIALAQEALNTFDAVFREEYDRLMASKLGFDVATAASKTLVQEFLSLLSAQKLDFTLSFRVLGDLLAPTETPANSLAEIYPLPPAMAAWLAQWRAEIANQTSVDKALVIIQASNPALIPRNHLVEAAIQAATRQGDFAPFHQLVDNLAKPFDFDPDKTPFALPPKPEQIVRQTFCGT